MLCAVKNNFQVDQIANTLLVSLLHNYQFLKQRYPPVYNFMFACKESLIIILTLVSTIVISSCYSTNNLEFKNDDVKALNKIYDSSPWQFSKSSVHLRVHENNTIEIEIMGEASSKKDQAENSLFLPVASVLEIPQYIKATTQDGKDVEIQSFKIANGLWTIVAVIPINNPIESQDQTNPTSLNPVPIKLKTILISPNFSGSLPIIIPAGQSSSVVETSVTLPDNYEFSSQTFTELKQDASNLQTLTKLPVSITDGNIRAAVTIPSRKVDGWNFSSLQYHGKGYAHNLIKYVYLISLVLVFLVLLRNLFHFFAGNSYRKRRDDTNRLAIEKNKKIVLLLLLCRKLSLNHSFYRYDIKEIHKTLEEIETYNFGFAHESEEKLISKLKKQKQNLSEMLNREREHRSGYYEKEDISTLKELFNFEWQLSNLITEHLEFNHYIQERYEFERRHMRQYISKYFFIPTLALVLLLLLNIYANGQENIQNQEKTDVPVVALGDFTIRVQQPEQDSNRLKVVLDFIPLALKAIKEEKGVVSIETGNDSINIVDTPTAAPQGVANLLSYNKRLIKVTASPTYTTASVLGILSQDLSLPVTGFRSTRNYQETINNGHTIKLDYILEGAFKKNERCFYGWAHCFPSDSLTYEIPLKLDQLAILENIVFEKPPDLSGYVTAEGFNAKFIEQTKDSFRLELDKNKEIATIQAKEEVKIKATLGRSWFQWLILIPGQFILAIIAGIILGFFASLPENHSVGRAIEIVGIFGLPILLRTSVFSTYKLPTILSGQTPTYFEICFLISWILFAIVALIAWGNFNPHLVQD